MKTISEYNQEQLLALTDEDVNKIIDFQCALNGVQLLPEEPIQPKELDIEPDTVVYGVAGFTFKEKESAEIVQQAINSQVMVKVDYDYNVGYDYKYVSMQSDQAATIEVTKHMSMALYDSLKMELARFKAENSTFESLNKTYNSISEERASISDQVWTTINDARDARDYKLVVMQRFEKYVGLADGDKTLANKFFADAYPDDVHFLISEDEKAA